MGLLLLRAMLWENKVDRSYQFNMEEFITVVSSCLGMSIAPSSARGMA